MWDGFIAFFAKRHMLANMMFIGVMAAGVYFWFATNKEEMPNVTRDFVAISTSYPGASAEQVEHFITREIEEKLKGLDGIYRVTSNSSAGGSSIRVELEFNRPDRDQIVTDIKAAAYDADLPDEVIEDPYVREFKSSKRAIIDIALYDKSTHLLTKEKRAELQKFALNLENQLLNLKNISEVNRNAYRNPEIRIEADPRKLKEYNISLNTMATEIRAQNSRQPAGSLEDRYESKVTLDSELDTVAELERVIILGGFEGQKVRVRDIGRVTENFEKTKFIQKINGYEGIILSAVKNADADILVSVDEVKRMIRRYRNNTIKGTDYEIAVLDDESRVLRNRLDIILYNGIIGLTLVLAVLLAFLNFHTAFWVAMGIPFTLAFTMVGMNMLGYTINNMTLGAVIIVMGMIVDDAIVVAENISRYRSEGVEFEEASVKATSYVLLPITAAILTTCLSFAPLLMNIGGWHGVMIAFLPPVIFMMLGASLLESVLILPSHMNIRLPAFMMGMKKTASGRHESETKKNVKKTAHAKAKSEERVRHWFLAWELGYGRFLQKIMKRKLWVILMAFLLLAGTIWTAAKFMKFTMFPRTESDQINLMGEAPRGIVAAETALLVQSVEDTLLEYLGKEMVGLRTDIARSRRGRAVEENKFRINMELVPRDKRKKSLKQLVKEWEDKLKPYLQGFAKLEFSQGWWGGDSDSPIQILVKDNNDQNRAAFAADLAEMMKKIPDLDNVEVDKPLTNPEYKLDIKRDEMTKLGISAASIRSTLRSAVEGLLLYELKGEDEELYVRLTIPESSKERIDDILDTPVENKGNYLVPLRSVVSVAKEETPADIERLDYIRTLIVYADMRDGTKKTPLEIAEQLETTVFPELENKYPTTGVEFTGEVFDSRKTQQDVIKAILIALILIYAVLALLFNSPYKPLIILSTIPFGMVGVIWCLISHGMSVYGFFSLIGGLGMMGVVINDSIVMLSKLDREYDKCGHKDLSDQHIAEVAKTRLQAVLLTTLTTVAALFPTAYGWAGYDSMLSEMMLVMGWGLIFGTVITLVLVPCLYGFTRDLDHWLQAAFNKSTAKECAS
ncbi:efflux RND transporter permease subunit [candidate division FCPU426 bacterium]|nr:efflux RND transporter permease subunit [candidate division FCPU426 bacterium]